jgi:hypothetical protein
VNKNRSNQQETITVEKDMKLVRFVIYFIVISLQLISCKKDTLPSGEDILSPTTGTRTEFTLDSIYLYAKEVYLWSDALPSYTVFNPRQYTANTPEIAAFKTELLAITQLKKNPETNSPYELPVTAGSSKYSYLQRGTSAGITAATESPVQGALLKTSIIVSAGRDIGYLALGSFPRLSASKTELDEAFAFLATAKPRYLVLDLRSNGGGYVETAEYIANLIATASLNGKTMYTEQYNVLLQSGKATILKHQPYLDEQGKPVSYNGRNATMADVDFTEAGNSYYFDKKGPLTTTSHIYFIVSSYTASASELLISCLKPYFNVRLVGTRTYGKPVGFFAINIDQYSVYLSSFLIRNSQGWSDYFTGIPADIEVTGKGTPLLGDPEEACLKAALADISGTTARETIDGSIIKAGKTLLQAQTDRNTAASDPAVYTHGMIESRLKIKR